MSESFIQKTERELTSTKQLGLYKLLFSQKVAFCFILQFISTIIVAFSAWAVCKHIIDSATFGAVVATYGGITATIAGVYNIVHGINDRAAAQIVAATATASAAADVATNTATAATVATTNTAAAATTDSVNTNLPSRGTL